MRDLETSMQHANIRHLAVLTAVLGAAFLLGLLSGCTLPYTVGLDARLQAEGVPVERVQFYSSHGFRLQRDVDSMDAGVAEGKIRLEHGRYVEVIVVPARTPGVCQRVYRARLEGEKDGLALNQALMSRAARLG